MNILPLVLEDMILDYKAQLEHVDKFNKSLDWINFIGIHFEKFYYGDIITYDSLIFGYKSIREIISHINERHFITQMYIKNYCSQSY